MTTSAPQVSGLASWTAMSSNGVLVLLRHGESVWNAENLFTGWVDVPLSETGRAGGPPRRRAAGRGRPAARRRAHLAAAPRDLHRQPRPRRLRPALDPGPPRLAAQRAALRRAAGQGQEADARRVTARSSSCSGAAPTTCRRRRSSRTRSSPRPATRATPTSAPTMPATECLADVVARFLPYWERPIVPRPAGRQDRAGRRARQLAARARQAPRRDLRRRHRRAEHPHRASRCATTSTTTCGRPTPAAPTSTRRPPQAAIAAVANQGR